MEREATEFKKYVDCVLKVSLEVYLATLLISVDNPFVSLRSSQGPGTSSLSLVRKGKGDAFEGHEKDEKFGYNVGKRNYEYRKGREVEVRCCGRGRGWGSEPVEM